MSSPAVAPPLADVAFGRLLLPGPADVRPEVLRAMQQPMLSHLAPELVAMLQRMEPRLQRLFRTSRPVLHCASSATGFMDSAIRCGVRRKVLVVVNGVFGGRFVQTAESCGKEVVALTLPLGANVTPDQLDAALRKSGADAVALVHSETSTGALAPLQALAQVVRGFPDVMLLVDAVTSVGGSPVETDAWGLDFVFTGSQKALALPPGVALGVASERLMARTAQLPARGFYLDLIRLDEATRSFRPNQTPALSILYALDYQLACIEASGGVEARWERHYALHRRMEAWVDAHPEVTVLAPRGERSWTVSAFRAPAGQSAPKVVQEMKRRGWTIAAGLFDTAESVLRIGHMGDLELFHLDAALDALEDVLAG